MGQSFADWLVTIPENRFLGEMGQSIPWGMIEETLKEHIPNPGGGRPPYSFLLLFKMSLLQWWYGLGDLEVEFQCCDRLSFRKFLGLGMMDKVPDGTTLAEFRHKLEAQGLQEKLLKQLEETWLSKGLLARKGTMVDATFVQAARPKADPERKTGPKGNGFSGSMAVDRASKLIRRVVTTPASVHDSQSLEAVLPEQPGQVYADLGYHGEPCQQRILKKDGTPCVGYKKPKHQSLLPWQKGINTILNKVRAGVEHVFGRIKSQFNLKNSRYQGLTKVNAYLHGMALAYNFQRLGFLRRRNPRVQWV